MLKSKSEVGKSNDLVGVSLLFNLLSISSAARFFASCFVLPVPEKQNWNENHKTVTYFTFPL